MYVFVCVCFYISFGFEGGNKGIMSSSVLLTSTGARTNTQPDIDMTQQRDCHVIESYEHLRPNQNTSM